MSRELTLTKQGLLMWRLGPLQFNKQGEWDRAPEKKGMWAFPYPYYEPFFTYHQYLHNAPKSVRYDSKTGTYIGTKFKYCDPALADVPVDRGAVMRDVEQYKYFGPLGEVEVDYDAPSLYEAQYKWVKEVGMKTHRLRKFYWTGDVHCHFDKSGEVLDVSEWRVMDVRDLARLITKTRGDRAYGDYLIDVPNRITPTSVPSKYSHDHFEVFLTSKSGRMNGRIIRRSVSNSGDS